MRQLSADAGKSVLDEAINWAKKFSTADSGRFYQRGVLDAVLKEHLARCEAGGQIEPVRTKPNHRMTKQ